MIQGQSAAFTLYKEMGLAAVFAAAIARHRFANPFVYVDLNAGCGWNERANVKGSAIVFLETAERLGVSYRADFFERDPGLAGYLTRIVGGHPCCSIHLRDNRDFVARLALDKRATGLLLVDPNSYAGIPRPEDLNRLPPTMDIVVSWNSGSVKRAVAHSRLNPQKNYKPIIELDEFLAGVARTNWLIRQPVAGDIHQWTMLVASNRPLYDQVSDGLVSIRSHLGRQIVHHCSQLGSIAPPGLYFGQQSVSSATVIER